MGRLGVVVIVSCDTMTTTPEFKGVVVIAKQQEMTTTLGIQGVVVVTRANFVICFVLK